MNYTTLKRIAIIGAILTVFIAIDGLYMVLANYKPDDTSNNGFGAFHPSDGQTILIAAGLLLIISALAYYLSTRASAQGAQTLERAEEPTREDAAVEPEVNA